MILMPITKDKSELLGTIESLRKELIRIGNQEGLSSRKTIEISQKLDLFISKYQTIRF